MARTSTFVIVGGGLAGAKAAEGLREHGHDGRIVVVGAERHRPYERPPLSKGYLMGKDALETAFVHPGDWYDDNDVELRLGAAATAIDLEGHTLEAGGESIGYDRLLLATGASARRLAMADDGAARPAYLRTIEDSDRIKAALRPGQRVVVIGGGWIGLEVAAAARTAGSDVVLVESLELPLLRILGAEVAGVVARMHREHGVDLRTGAVVSSVESTGGQAVVRLGDGAVLEADLVVVGVGVTPNVALAEAAGLDVDNGVLVDEYLRTSHPDVLAAGDVASAYHPGLGRRVRVEHWDNAMHQGLTAARTMLGHDAPYLRMPYFFTDQYDFGMEYVGAVGPEGYDEVVLRGDVPGRVFTAFWLTDGVVVAGMHANDWDAIDAVRRVVEARTVDVAALRSAEVSLDDVAG